MLYIWYGYVLMFFLLLLGIICEVNMDCKYCISYVCWKSKICNYFFDEIYSDCYFMDFWWLKFLGSDWVSVNVIGFISVLMGFVFILCLLCFCFLYKVMIFFFFFVFYVNFLICWNEKFYYFMVLFGYGVCYIFFILS